MSGKVFADEAAGLYERATTTTLKNCVLLYFAYADFEEVISADHVQKSVKIFLHIYIAAI